MHLPRLETINLFNLINLINIYSMHTYHYLPNQDPSICIYNVHPSIPMASTPPIPNITTQTRHRSAATLLRVSCDWNWLLLDIADFRSAEKFRWFGKVTDTNYETRQDKIRWPEFWCGSCVLYILYIILWVGNSYIYMDLKESSDDWKK